MPVTESTIVLPTGDSERVLTDGTNKWEIVSIDDGTGNIIVPAKDATLTGGNQVTKVNAIVGVVDNNNSTTTPLGISGVFTGTATEILNYSHIQVMIMSDKPSATDGFQIQFSGDGTNWDETTSRTYADNGAGETYFFSARGKYYRIVYTNTNSAQSYFRLTSILKIAQFPAGSTTMDEPIVATNHAIVGKNVIWGKTTAGGDSYVAVKVNPSGALTADVTQANSPWVTSDTSANSTLTTISNNITTMLGNQTDGDQIVKGNNTPSDNVTNPTTAINNESFLMFWNTVTSRWQRVTVQTVLDGDSVSAARLRTHSALLGYNGSSYDTIRGDSTNGLDVDVTRSALPTGAATEATLTNGNQIAQAYFKTGTSTYQVPRLDVITHSVRTVDYPHSEMHNGDHFYYTDVITLGSSATQDYMITTPNTTRWGHFEFELKSQYKVTVNLYEASDKTGTTSQTIFNNNRNSATTETITLHKGTSGGTTDGTQIWWCTDGSASAAGNPGDLRSGEGELILKQNTKYILRLTSGAANNDICVKLWWYEHTNLTA